MNQPVLWLYNKSSSLLQSCLSHFHRYLSKDEVAQTSLNKAQQEGGSVRLVAKEHFSFSKRRSAPAVTPPATQR